MLKEEWPRSPSFFSEAFTSGMCNDEKSNFVSGVLENKRWAAFDTETGRYHLMEED